MQGRHIARLSAGLPVAVVGLFAFAAPAAADTPATLYVNNAVTANCSDTGTGTQAQPYCTIAAAVAVVVPGQTINVTGTYDEHVTIAKSGTPGHPITLEHSVPGTAILSGPEAGITIDGQHDISLGSIHVTPQSFPGVAIRNSTDIALHYILVGGADNPASVGVQLSAVTDSTLKDVRGVRIGTGITLDAATSRVVVTSPVVEGITTGTGGPGIDVWGSDNTVVDGDVGDGGAAAIAVEPGAANNIVANNRIVSGHGDGIDNTSATGTAITNNTVSGGCGNGIRVAGSSSGVSVQNNAVQGDGPTNQGCALPPVEPVDVGVYDAAVNHTLVDYNNVSPVSGQLPYAWQTPMDLPTFRAASGQGAHDSTVRGQAALEDSANSAAPGFQSTDRTGNPREDDPAVANTGAGPVSYADRGAFERIQAPFVQIAVQLDQAAVSVTADASGTTGWVPIAAYTFNFSDGTVVTQSSPVMTHHYAKPGSYSVAVTATDAQGIAATDSRQVSLLPALRTIALLSRSNDRYVSVVNGQNRMLFADSTTIGPAEQFDVVDAGNGLVVLRSRPSGLYVTEHGDPDRNLVATATSVDPTNVYVERFTIVTNADGSISLRSFASGWYVTAEAGGTQPLVADRSAIGPWEKFNTVDVHERSVSLRANANGDYVTAENAGTQPLVANRRAVGPWEQFDIVDAGNGYVALYSHADARFVSAEAAGGQPLIANRTTIGDWEKFKLISNADGTVSFIAKANGRYVTAEAAGARPLIANRTTIGPWEKFTIRS